MMAEDLAPNSGSRVSDVTRSATTSATLLLNAADDVLIALRPISKGERLSDGIVALDEIPPGHKVARRAIARGEGIKRYNSLIGAASADIEPGAHIHLHNLEMLDVARDYSYCSDVHPTPVATEMRTFQGFIREDGRAATRNYIGVISSVNCSATVARMVADHFRGRLDKYPNVDGVVPLTHKRGCGLDAKVEGVEALRRCIAGYAAHPNFAQVIIIGLGCEVGDLGGVLGGAPGDALVIQQSGGTAATVRAGIERVEAALERANNVRRVPVPVSELKVALQCGGSDGYSGVSVNAALGYAVDLLVAQGATAILSVTKE